MRLISEIIFQVVVGVFMTQMWGVDFEKIGIVRFLVGWVFGTILLIHVWAEIEKRYFKN